MARPDAIRVAVGLRGGGEVNRGHYLICVRVKPGVTECEGIGRQFLQFFGAAADTFIKRRSVLFAEMVHNRVKKRIIVTTLPKSGTALTEYVLPLALIGLVVLYAVPNILPSMKRQVDATMISTLGLLEGQQAPQPQMSATLPQAPSSGAFPEEMGGAASAENASAAMAKNVETLGAAGTTTMLTQDFQKNLDQMVLNGEITPEQKAVLDMLADQGQQIAAIQRLIEEAANESNGNPEAFRAIEKEYNGQMYTTSELIMMISASDKTTQEMPSSAQGYYNAAGSNPLATDAGTVQSLGREVDALGQLYAEAAASGVLNEPEVQALVYQYSQNIFYLGQSLAYSSAKVYTDQASPTQLTQDLASEISRDQANKICDVADSIQGRITGSGDCHK